MLTNIASVSIAFCISAAVKVASVANLLISVAFVVSVVRILSWLGDGYGVYLTRGRRWNSDSPRAFTTRPETEGWINPVSTNLPCHNLFILYCIISQSIIFAVKNSSHNSYASAESNSELNAYV